MTMKRPLPLPWPLPLQGNTVDLRKLWGKLKFALLNWWAIPGWSANLSLQNPLSQQHCPCREGARG